MSSLVGRIVLGRYRVLSLIARGGMGEVYLARSEGAAGFHKPVVVKRILAQHASDPMILGLFQREARVMSSLRHRNIVSVLDFGVERDDHVMVLEYVHGFHLGRWLRWASTLERPFPAEQGVQIALEVLAALEHAHEARAPDGSSLGIVHRDVSPANVLIDVDGAVKLADFGIARMAGEHTVVEGSQPSVKGKFPYLPREMFEGATATPATDVYALGVVLDEILRGKNAFKAGQMAETLARVLGHVPEPLNEVRDDVGPELAAVVAKAIAKSEGDRFQSAAEMAAALRAARRASTDDVVAELHAAARRDFLDPEMAASLELPSLTELEALWRGPAPPVEEDEGALPGAERPSVHTVPQRGAQRRADRAAASRRNLALGVVAALALTVLAVVGYATTRPARLETDGAPLFVVVDHTVTADAGTIADTGPSGAAVAGESALVDVLAPEPEDEGEDPGPPRAGRTEPRPSRAAPVEAPFRARRAEVSRCFSTHVRALEGTPEIWVRFSVREDGTVASATLEPGEIGGTPLGQCILDVARSTRFSASEAPLAFRVPLGARRVGGE